jgi:hypothetical protein
LFLGTILGSFVGMNTPLGTSIVAILCILIGGNTSATLAQSPSTPTTMEMKAFVEPAYQLAMTIDDQEALLKALKRASDKKQLVKIPVLIQRSNDVLRGWSAAYIGPSTEALKPIDIRLDDTALGLSLADRIFQYCPTGEWCKLWLVGYWMDRMVPSDECSPGMKRRALSLSIRHVVGPQVAGDAAVAYIAKH